MKVLVLHNSLNSLGGGEIVCLHTIRLLMEKGYTVHIATIEPTNWKIVTKVTGIDFPIKPVAYALLPFPIKSFSVYQRPLLSYYTIKMRKKYELIISTFGDIALNPADITYLHFPMIAYAMKNELKPYIKYYSSRFWYIYYQPYVMISKLLMKRSFRNTLLLTNSKFTQQIIKEVIGKNSIILYPPIKLEDYFQLLENEEREDSILYIGRFSEEKNNHILIHIARQMPEYKFYLIGTVAGKGLNYYNYCRRLKEKYNVKNIEILPNLPHKDKLKIMSKSKVYVHLMKGEHFGIAPAEAMASGLIPIVHKISGAWTDILEEGKYGLGFIQFYEIPRLIEEALKLWDQKLWKTYSEHLKKFSAKAFYKKLDMIIETYLRMKNMS